MKLTLTMTLSKDHYVTLFSQGSGYKGKILTRILVSRSEIDLAKVKQEYQKKFGKSLYKDIQVNKS